MKLNTITTLCGLAAAVAVSLPTSTTMAQSRAATRDANTTQQQRNNSGPSARTRNLDSATSGKTVRASQLIGMNVHNNEGEAIAEINDLVVDPQSGKIQYAAVTYGGFLGMGDKLFAVPFQAFDCKSNPDDADEQMLYLNVTEKQLENAKGFDQDNWPDFGDKSFTDQVDSQYGANRMNRRTRNNRDGINVDVNRRGVDVDVNGR